MKEVNIKYNPLPAQQQFHSSPAKYRLYSGAFRAGKTKAGCQEALKLSLRYPHNRGLIGRKDFPDLRDTTQYTFFQELRLYEEAFGYPLGDIKFGKSEGTPGFRKQENIFRFKPSLGGSEILFRQLKDPEDFKSLEIGWFYLDEGTETTEDMFKMLISRLTLVHIPRLCGFITTNPDTPNHWLFKYFFKSPTDEFGVVQTTTYDNPYLPEGYASGLEGIYDEDYQKRYLKGQWGVMSGLVYEDFSQDIHVIKPFPIPPSWKKIRAIDFGYRNPFVCLWLAVDNDDCIYIYREHYQSKMDIEDHAKIIIEYTGDENIENTYADPSAAQQRADLRRYGVPNLPADNTITGKNELEVVGIQAMQRRLKIQDNGRPQLYVFDICTSTIMEFGAYKWMDAKGDINEKETPLKLNDHSMDSARYGLNALDRRREVIVEEVEF